MRVTAITVPAWRALQGVEGSFAAWEAASSGDGNGRNRIRASRGRI